MPISVTDNDVRVLEELIGEANVYVNVTVPADGAEVALVAGVPATGTWLGLTDGDSVFEVKQEVKGKEVEQVLGELAQRVTKEEASVKVTLAQATYDKLALTVNNATTGANGTAGTHFVKMGGKTRIVPKSLLLVSPIENEDGSVRYEWLMLYKAVPNGNPKVKYKRGQTRVLEVEFKAVPVPTRTRGDQLYQFIQDDPLP